MAIQIQGMDKLIQKLNKISNLEAREIIEDVANDVQEAIVNKAKEFSTDEYKHVGKAEIRDYGTSYFVDIGLSGNLSSFEQYKGLWFHQWGYHNWGRNGIYKGMYMSMHIMWFNQAVSSVEKQALEKIKRKVRAEIRAFKC